MPDLPFLNRAEAGRLLARELASRGLPKDCVVLALPRGGVPVGAVIARELGFPLDVIIVRKLGVPWQPELAMGAIAGAARVLDSRMIRHLGISSAQVDEVVAREQVELQRREHAFRSGRPQAPVAGRTAILVDDGLATGNTMAVAVRHLRALKPARIIAAVPVGSQDACERLQNEADEVICLDTPYPFYAVGEWYRDFNEVTDDDVRMLLDENRAPEKVHAAGSAD